MFVYIAHAEADQAAADDLKALLKSRGLVVETETGAKGFHHLQPSDVVVALWSDKQVFSNYRMVVERRMLDAWADGRLVLAKLDHSFLPVGLRDLPAIDASFANNRELAVWPQVERAAREAMNRALVAQQAQDDEFVVKREGEGPGASGGGGTWKMPSAAVTPMSGVVVGPALLAPFAIVISIVGALWLHDIVFPDAAHPDRWIQLGALVGMTVANFILLALLFAGVSWLFELPSRRRRRQGAGKAAPEAEARPQAVFISYSHADDAKVAPVVKLVETSGHCVWIDKTGIHTGDGWAGEIVRAIRAAGGIVVMCTKHAFESDHIKREVYLADRYKKPMVPVFLEEARPPEDFEYFFASVQWLELFKSPQREWPAAIGKALKAM